MKASEHISHLSKKFNLRTTSPVILNDTGHGSLAESFSSNNSLSVIPEVNSHQTPGKGKSRPSLQITDWRETGGMSFYFLWEYQGELPIHSPPTQGLPVNF